jgi:Tfp pilus assembly protein PilE
MEAVHSKIINKRRIFSWTNILIGLAILSLLSVAAYFYWPQEKLRSNITDTTNSLLDISNLPQKQTAG